MSKLIIKLGVMVVGLAVASFNACADNNQGNNENNQGKKGKAKNAHKQSRACAAIGAFDAFEAGGALCGPIRTHLAGKSFTLDVVAVKSGAVDTGSNQNITVGLVDASAAGFNCATATPIAGSKVSADLNNGIHSYTFTVTNAYQDLQVQVTDGHGEHGGAVTCTDEHFSVRPQSFSVSSSNAYADPKGSSATATPTVTVGANFALSAKAVNEAGVTVTGYDGTPMIDVTRLARPNAAAGVLTGGFAAATGGVASGTFAYSEVGYFRILAQGVYDDSFTAVDQTGDPATSDCVIGSASNTPDASGRVGCNIGNAADTAYFGRFVQDANAYKGSDTYIYRGRRGR